MPARLKPHTVLIDLTLITIAPETLRKKDKELIAFSVPRNVLELFQARPIKKSIQSIIRVHEAWSISLGYQMIKPAQELISLRSI